MKSFNIDSSALVFEDSLNGISKLKFGGSLEALFKEDNDSTNIKTPWNIYVNDKFSKISYCMKGKENLKIIDQSSEVFNFNFDYPYQLSHGKELGNYILVLNDISNEIQLIDNKYNINPNLFRASKMTCIDDINNDNSNELMTIIDNNVLVCYQIPTIN